MAGKEALLWLRYEREREKNLLENQQMLAQLFGTKDTPAAPSRRNTSKLLTSKEVDALEQLYESKKSNSTQPPSQPVRFVFDHVSISRRTPRQAAQETTKRVKEDVKILSSQRNFYSRNQNGERPVEALSKEVRERQAKLLKAGRVNHCHLCANFMKSGWIPCSRCEQRFHYLCLKRRLKIITNKFTMNWLCPICREVCNCDDCRDSEWKHSNRPVRRLQSSGYGWRRGSEEAFGDDVDTDQSGQKNGQRRSQRKQLRSVVEEKGDGWEDKRPRLSCRGQPRRAAAQATKGHFREVESLIEDEDDWVTPSSRGTTHERESERRSGNYFDDVESGEDVGEVDDGGEVEDEGDVDKSGEDADSDGDEDNMSTGMEGGQAGHYLTSKGPLG